MPDFQSYVVMFFIWLIPTIVFLAILKNRSSSNLPPGPHQALHKLSVRYGTLFRIFLGSYPCLIISSPEMAKGFLKTQEAYCLDRPQIVATEYLSYGSKNLMFSPYGPYWKFLKKLCMSELLGGRTLDLLQTVRRYEIQSMINVMLKKSLDGEAVDVGAQLTRLTNNAISSMLMKKRCSENEDEAGDIRNLIKELFHGAHPELEFD